jgi:hypothetical protein
MKFPMQSLNWVQANLNIRNVKEKGNQIFLSLKLFSSNNQRNLKSKKMLRWFLKIHGMKKWKLTSQTCLNPKFYQFSKKWNSKFYQFYSNIWQTMNKKIRKTLKKIKMIVKIFALLQLFVMQKLFVNLIRSLFSSIYTSYSI